MPARQLTRDPASEVIMALARAERSWFRAALSALVLIAAPGMSTGASTASHSRTAGAPDPAQVAATDAVNTWQFIGPLYSTTPSGNQITGNVVDVDAHNLRVLGGNGGLWRFYFGAIPMSDSIPSGAFGSFASPTSDPNTILVGANQAGLYRSIDGGATWTRRTLAYAPSRFARIRYSPDGSVAHAATDVGYFGSTDAGAS